MQINYFVKCAFCGMIADVKYQLGNSKKHPIRFKCKCGISIQGEYCEGRGVVFENANVVSEDVLPGYVVHVSGEFLTVPPYIVKCEEDIMKPSTFIFSAQRMDYVGFSKELNHVTNYRDYRWKIVRGINELFLLQNNEVLTKTIKKSFHQIIGYLPLSTDVDISRAVFIINQFQFLDYDGKGVTKKVTDLFVENFKENTGETQQLVEFVNGLGIIKDWRVRIFSACNQIYENIDLLLPAIGIDYYKENIDDVLSGSLSITTTSFEEIKQLYVDLYELICDFAIVLIGLDNIVLRGNYDLMCPDIDSNLKKNITNLTKVSEMKNKGNILKIIDFKAPFEVLICDSLNSDIRNSIGHFSYDSLEISSNFGQKIRFYDSKKKDNCIEKSLVQICYDIWHMYKSLGVFNEVIYRIEMLIRATRGEKLTVIKAYESLSEVSENRGKRRKIYPNELCSCGSGKKYKKCCGKTKRINSNLNK